MPIMHSIWWHLRSSLHSHSKSQHTKHISVISLTHLLPRAHSIVGPSNAWPSYGAVGATVSRHHTIAAAKRRLPELERARSGEWSWDISKDGSRWLMASRMTFKYSCQTAAYQKSQQQFLYQMFLLLVHTDQEGLRGGQGHSPLYPKHLQQIFLSLTCWIPE